MRLLHESAAYARAKRCEAATAAKRGRRARASREGRDGKKVSSEIRSCAEFCAAKYDAQRDVFKTLRSFRRRIASSISNSVRPVKLKPSLSQAFGNMLIAVKPGIELISLR